MQNLFFIGLKRFVNTSFFLSFASVALSASPSYGVQLNFNSVTGDLTNGNSNGVGATMRFNDVANDNGTNVDLVITTLNNYQSANYNTNGVINSNDGQINILNNTSTTFQFDLVEADTTTPYAVSAFDLGVYDIDGTNAGTVREILTLYSDNNFDYTLANTTALTTQVYGDRVVFTSPLSPQIANPTDSTMLTEDQEKHSVSFSFNNTSEFQLGYQVIGGDPIKGRNFFFAGDVVFDDTTTTTNTFQSVPFEFNPSLGLFLSGGTWLGVNYLKRRKNQII
jgi:hypothetical protein